MLLEILSKTSDVVGDVVGIVGVVLLLIAYYLLNTHQMSAKSMNYQVLNLFGALFIIFSLCFHWNTASALIEVSWVIISVIGMYHVVKSRKALKAQGANLYAFESSKKKKHG